MLHGKCCGRMHQHTSSSSVEVVVVVMDGGEIGNNNSGGTRDGASEQARALPTGSIRRVSQVGMQPARQKPRGGYRQIGLKIPSDAQTARERSIGYRETKG